MRQKSRSFFNIPSYFALVAALFFGARITAAKTGSWDHPKPTAPGGVSRTTRSAANLAPKSAVLPDSTALGPDSKPALEHVTRRGESVLLLARHYLNQTEFMTVPELEAAIEHANSGLAGKTLKPGTRIVIPGYLSAPIVEKPVVVPKDFEVRAIYLTAYTAGSEKGIDLIRRWHDAGGNAVVFDLKDFDGWVSVPFDNPLKPDRGFVLIHNLPKFIHFLHSLHMHAIVRIACFRDAAMAAKHPELAPRSRRTGGAWHEGKGPDWTDPSLRKMQDYNLALARLAVASGADEVQLDYVRFPAEGDQKDAKFAFQAAHPDWPRSNVVTDFVTRAYNEVHPSGVLLSLDVFGVMAWERKVDLEHTGQDIPELARHCDVLSPMIYPSHFFHFDDYTDPGDAPEHFISEAMQRFEHATTGSGVVIRPWLQAFGWRTKTYSPAYIMTQVSVSKENGAVGFLFWNARNDYAKPFKAMVEMLAQPARYFQADGPRSGSRVASSAPAAPASAASKAGANHDAAQ